MSEVARLRRQIELECEAIKRAMEAFRVAAPHDIIQQQYNGIVALQDQLAALIGDQEAIVITMETYIDIVG